MGDGWGEGVADLAVGGGFAAGELPVVGEALDAGGHAEGEAGHFLEAFGGSFFSEGLAVDAEAGPGVASAGGAEVGSAVLFGAADEGGGDFVGFGGPFEGVLPAVGGHEIDEGFADGFGGDAVGEGHGRVEVFGEILADGDDDDAGAELGDSEVGCVEQVPACEVAHVLELLLEAHAVVGEDGIKETTDIFEHDGLGLAFVYKAEGFGEEVALVVGSELLASNGKRGAGDAAGEEIDSFEFSGGEVADVAFDNVPVRSVELERGAGVAVVFDVGKGLESGPFQANRLSSGTGADFDAGEGGGA